MRPRSNVDPTRVALAALERIRTVLVKSGYKDRIGEPLSMKELAAQSQLLGTELPASYVAAMRVQSKIGEPENFLTSSEMAIEAERIAHFGGEEAKRYAPFCKSGDEVICFDTGGGRRLVSAVRHEGELPIVMWDGSFANPLAAHFGEWLDLVADAREESVASAARMPSRLKSLLYELGFRFEYPVVGRLETGDVDAIAELLGPQIERSVRGDVDRLFDSSGKASLTLNVDEFTLAVSLRTGIYVFTAEDVFRWLRHFRDENFFREAGQEAAREPSHPDQVRDLRRAPREAPLVHRGVLQVTAMPSPKHVFRSASGISSADFYLLGRTASTSEHAPSIVVHVLEGTVAATHVLDEPLHDLHAAPDGAVWGLGPSHVVRMKGGRLESFPLQRPKHGRPWWYGIGGGGDRVLVWGTGALLEFDGRAFVPFEPDAMLDESESVIAVAPHGLRISMLVCGDRMGAVAHFDSVQWQPIGEAQVIEGQLADLDVWRSTSYVLDRRGGMWKVGTGPPIAIALPRRDQAFLTEAGAPRPFHCVRAYDGGLLLASDGGIVVVGKGDPVFHSIGGGRSPARLVRVGPGEDAKEDRVGIVALIGHDAWMWKDQEFSPIDLRDT
jgi:hypothetical protein